MIKNYFKIAFRNLFREKGFSLLNLSGLVSGITACLLILQYVSFELNFDRFHKDADRIYRVTNDRFQQGKLVQHGTITYPTIGPAMARDFSEVEMSATLANPGTFSLQKNKSIIEEKGIYADPHFFRMFSFPLTAGDPETALKTPYSIVISESSALKTFGKEAADFRNLLGKTILIDLDTRPYLITGIMKDFPPNSHLQYNVVMSYETLVQTWGPWVKDSWENSDMWHYVKLKEGANAATLEKQFPAFSARYFRGDKVSGSVEKFHLQPLLKAHLFSRYEYEIAKTANGKAVLTLLVIAGFILLIAWINYINLATTRSLERAREVGVRKVAGATSGQLIWQFMSESILLNALAFTLAITITVIVQPAINQLIDKPLSLSLLVGGGFGGNAMVALLAGVFMLGTLLSGLYPAFILANFKAIQVLKGAFKRSVGGIRVRQSLVVFQYTASIVLIVGTFIIFRQLKFMREENLGFNMDQVLVFRGPELTRWDSTGIARIDAFKAELQQIPSVQLAASSGSLFGNRLSRSFNVKKVSSNDTQGVTVSRMSVDASFFGTYKIKLLAGRSFLPTDSFIDGDKVKSTVLNQSASKLLGFKNPEEAVGQLFMLNGKEWEIVGIVNDFHQQSLKNAIEPIVFAPFYTLSGFFSVKLGAGFNETTIASLKETYDTFFPGNNFHYFFMNEKFNEQYNDDQLFGQIATFFALMAVLIASLGIFGLSSYTIAQRTKEIGVRKVLGATVGNIVTLVSKDFLKLVVVAILIGSPIAWFVIREWLNDFAYRVELKWWMFALAGLASILVAMLSISSQAIKAALTNPSKTFKTD